MTTVDPRRAAETMIEAMNTRVLDRLVSLLAEGAVFHFPGTDPLEGPERIGRFLRILFYRYPELRFTVGRTIADERSVAVEWTNEGTDRKGEPYRNAGVTVIEIDERGIVYLSDTFKDTSFNP